MFKRILNLFKRILNLFKRIPKLPHEIFPEILEWKVGDQIDYKESWYDYYEFVNVDSKYIYLIQNENIYKFSIKRCDEFENIRLRDKKSKEKSKLKKLKFQEDLEIIKANNFYLNFLEEYQKLNDT